MSQNRTLNRGHAQFLKMALVLVPLKNQSNIPKQYKIGIISLPGAAHYFKQNPFLDPKRPVKLLF